MKQWNPMGHFGGAGKPKPLTQLKERGPLLGTILETIELAPVSTLPR